MINIADPALRAALQEAQAERLALWVSVWPVTLLVLSYILKKNIARSMGRYNASKVSVKNAPKIGSVIGLLLAYSVEKPGF
jgi:hypothetical protein